MAFELFNYGPVTPERLHAVLRLIARRPGLTRRQICDLVQPAAIADSQNAVRNVLATANSLGLVEWGESRQSEVRLTVPRKAIERGEDFRETVGNIVLGVIDSDAPNYVFNLFTAWYAALDDDVLHDGLSRPIRDIVVDFNDRVFSTIEGQQMNATKLAAWRPWAAFFGFGWPFMRGNRTFIVPDCTGRIAAVVERQLARDTKLIPFREFRDYLAATCPELDGGVLFERAWQSGHGDAERGQVVSLMLSTALRELHDTGRCRLESIADSPNTWSLFPATGEQFSTVTHIARGTGAASVQ